MTTTSVRSYDAVSLLGFDGPKVDPPIKPAPGEIVIRYGGWSLQQLRDSEQGKKLLQKQDWYNSESFGTASLPPGIYRLRIPVSDSNHRTFAEQEAMLPAGESPAPVFLIATALLVHKLQTGEDLLKNGWTRCKEKTTGGRVELNWRDGRLRVSIHREDDRSSHGWLASARAAS